MIKKITIILMATGLMACSQQNRYAEAPVDDAQLLQFVSEMLGDGQISAQSVEEANQMIYDQQLPATIFYGEGFPGSPMGTAQSVFAFEYFDFIDAQIYPEDLHLGRVVFLSNEHTGNYAMMLDVGFTEVATQILGNELITEYFYQVSEPEFTEDKTTGTRKFQVELVNERTGVSIVVQTFDLTNKLAFKPVIQLEVLINNNGELQSMGRFTKLVGFE